MEGQPRFGGQVGIYKSEGKEDERGWKDKLGVKKQASFSKPGVEEGKAEGIAMMGGKNAWQQFVDDEGRVFFHNAATEETSWTLPGTDAEEQQNAKKWNRYRDPSGTAYYANTTTNETTWDRPLSFATATPLTEPNGILPGSTNTSFGNLSDGELDLDLSALESPRAPEETRPPIQRAEDINLEDLDLDVDEKAEDDFLANDLDLDSDEKVEEHDFLAQIEDDLADGKKEEEDELLVVPRSPAYELPAFATALLQPSSSKRFKKRELGSGFSTFYDMREARRAAVEKTKPVKPVLQLPMTCCAKKLGGTLNREWNKKWLALTNTELSFAEDETGSANRKIVPLESVTSVSTLSDSVHGRQFVFQIKVTNQKDKVFQASSAALRDEWIAALLQLKKEASTAAQMFDASKMGETWGDMPGEFMFKPRSEKIDPSFTREVTSFFRSDTWAARWVWTSKGILSYAKKKGGASEKEIRLDSIVYCGVLDNDVAKEMEAPKHYWSKIFEIQTDGRKVMFATETKASRDKWVAYINDAMYSTSSVVAVTKEKKNDWMSSDWSEDRWSQWEKDALEFWEEDLPDAEIDIDMVTMNFVYDEEEWPTLPIWMKRAGGTDEDVYLASAVKDGSGHLNLNMMPMSLKILGFGNECSTQTKNQIKIGSRIVSVNNRPVSWIGNYRQALRSVSEAGVVLGLKPPRLDEERFESKEYETIISMPMTRGQHAPDPLVECMEFTPQEMREKRKIAKEKRKTKEREAHTAQQEKRVQKAGEAKEIHEKTAAKVSYAAHAVHAGAKSAIRDAKKKADQKFTGALSGRINDRFKEHFPEYCDEGLICDYKCLMRFEPSGGEREVIQPRDLDAHFMLTKSAIFYYSGGRSSEAFRGWIPLSRVVSIQFGELVTDEDTNRTKYATIDWVENDISKSDCLQIFTSDHHRYDFFKVRAISLEKIKKVDGVTAIGGLYSYLDICWRDLIEVPCPSYEYTLPGEAFSPLLKDPPKREPNKQGVRTCRAYRRLLEDTCADVLTAKPITLEPILESIE